VSANWCSGNIAYGLSKHKPFAIWRIYEAIANLGLSIILIHRIGIVGVAWGSVIPSLIINALLWPRYITKILHVPLADYLWQGWGRPALCVIPFAVACFISEKFWPAFHIASFFAQIAAILPLFGITCALVFRKELATYVRKTWSGTASTNSV
jgi:O-antigen/teichoic acid export membrane protein